MEKTFDKIFYFLNQISKRNWINIVTIEQYLYIIKHITENKNLKKKQFFLIYSNQNYQIILMLKK